MEQEGIRIAPIEEAVYFAREHMLPENKDIEPFAFHKWRGENADYPRFISPKKRIKNLVRPLLFHRRTRAWREKHGL